MPETHFKMLIEKLVYHCVPSSFILLLLIIVGLKIEIVAVLQENTVSIVAE